MAFMYSHAYCTIVAANGWDANHGLRGIKGVTDPRWCSADSRRTFLDEDLQPCSSIWYSRAWTLQELIFSRRIIMFHYQLVVWYCQCAAWHETSILRPRMLGACDVIEESGLPPNPIRASERHKGLHVSFWPDVKQYFNTVHIYSIRKLSFAQDVSAAFAGITSTFAQVFPAGFFYGLPKMFFHVALLSQPSHHSERRDVSDPEPVGNKFPSWSWMGWIGEVDPRSWESGYDYIDTINGMAVDRPTSSTIRWFCSGKRGQNRCPIETKYRLFENYRREAAANLPPEWNKMPGTNITDDSYFAGLDSHMMRTAARTGR